MLKLLIFSFLIAIANAFPIEEQRFDYILDRIIGGEVTSITALPYQVQLLRDGEPICGGVIISERWILSAAHCVAASASVFSVVTGSDELTSGQCHQVKEIFMHPAYNKDLSDNDISLIELIDNIEFNANQEPIQIATTVPVAGELITVSGFGKEIDAEGAPFSKKLKVTTIPVVNFEECRQKYAADNDPITNSVFCAGEGATDACQGDSGGPAVINRTLVGIVSAGMDCGDYYFPGLYTRAANYLQWINGIMNDKSSQQPTSHVFPLLDSPLNSSMHQSHSQTVFHTITFVHEENTSFF